jgi:hypothetical protein
MTSSLRLGAAVLAAVLAGCSNPLDIGDASDETGTPIPIVRLRAEPYSFTYYSGMDTPARLVIRDAVEWRVVWNEIHRRQSPLPTLPAVDFAREMIVIAALGSHSSGGYGILVDRAFEAGTSAISVAIRSISPGPRCGVTAAFTQPVDIARIPRRGNVRFVEHAEITDCK